MFDIVLLMLPHYYLQQNCDKHLYMDSLFLSKRQQLRVNNETGRLYCRNGTVGRSQINPQTAYVSPPDQTSTYVDHLLNDLLRPNQTAHIHFIIIIRPPPALFYCIPYK